MNDTTLYTPGETPAPTTRLKIYAERLRFAWMTVRAILLDRPMRTTYWDVMSTYRGDKGVSVLIEHVDRVRGTTTFSVAIVDFKTARVLEKFGPYMMKSGAPAVVINLDANCEVDVTKLLRAYEAEEPGAHR